MYYCTCEHLKCNKSHWQKKMEKLNLFHCVEIFCKYCRKRLENPISIVFSNSIVWKCFPWYEIFQKHSRINLEYNFYTVEVQFFQCPKQFKISNIFKRKHQLSSLTFTRVYFDRFAVSIRVPLFF